MDVYEAVKSRKAVRRFTDRPVPKKALEHVLAAAAWAPSGSNLQPWHVYVLAYEDVTFDHGRVGRAPLAETVTFVGG